MAQDVEAACHDIGYAFNGISAPANKNGLYSINYAAFTVPIIKAIQEQQQQVESLKPEGFDSLLDELRGLEEKNEVLASSQEALLHEVESLTRSHAGLAEENSRMEQQLSKMMALLGKLSDQVQNCCQAEAGADATTDDRGLPMNQPLLEQNIPNPFTENTLIHYSLPEGFRTASIIVTDVSGTQVLQFAINKPGFGHVVVEGGSLNAGTYVYTLIVNGRRIESKRMVLVM